MLRKLEESDRQAVLDYLRLEPAYNVFLIGDIENFGFDENFQEVWGEFDEGGSYRAVVLRYYKNHLVYSRDGDFDEGAVWGILGRAEGDWILSGKQEIVDRLAPSFAPERIRHQFLAELGSSSALPLPEPSIVIERATVDTIREVIELQSKIEEFGGPGASTDGVLRNLESGTGRTLFVRGTDGEVISAASSAAENSASAMIVGVCTLPEHRCRGYASACMTFLCTDLLKDGIRPCLFYDNLAAGRIYKRLGFRDAGRWATAPVRG